ncbi:MAG: hypothetical protein ABR498_01910, partial [Candidatus Dormibacteria bacterium]
ASESLATYALPRLAFEALMLDIFAGADSPPPVEPIDRSAVTGGRVSAGATAGKRRAPRAGTRGRSKAAG